MSDRLDNLKLFVVDLLTTWPWQWPFLVHEWVETIRLEREDPELVAELLGRMDMGGSE